MRSPSRLGGNYARRPSILKFTHFTRLVGLPGGDEGDSEKRRGGTDSRKRRPREKVLDGQGRHQAVL